VDGTYNTFPQHLSGSWFLFFSLFFSQGVCVLVPALASFVKYGMAPQEKKKDRTLVISSSRASSPIWLDSHSGAIHSRRLIALFQE